MKKIFYWMSIHPTTRKTKEIGVLATSFDQAIKQLDKVRGEYIPLEYLGWQEPEEKDSEVYKTSKEDRMKNLVMKMMI